MPIVSVNFSIHPGRTAPARAAVAQALRESSAPAGFLSMYLAEIGEVNTLCVFFTCESAESFLTTLDRWLESIQTSAAGETLRHIERVLHDGDATVLRWEAPDQPTSAALLLRIFSGPPPAAARSSADLVLSPMTGRYGTSWLLTPVASHDEALTLCASSTLDPDQALRDSVLWIPCI